MRRISLPLAALALFACLRARAGEPVAEYDLTTTEGGDSRATLVVRDDATVVRRVVYPDGSVHTYHGKGRSSGATLTVRFDGSGEPRDLTGEWTARGETASGPYRGTATFGLKRGQWAAEFEGIWDDETEDPTGTIEVRGRFDGGAFAALRRGPDDGDAAALHTAVYVLSPDGLALVTSGAGGQESFTRERLPATGRGPTATYTFEEGGRVQGSLSSGAADRGAKVARARAADARGPVLPDPIPAKLRVVRDASIRKTAAKDGEVAKAVKKDELVPVSGRENGFWVVGPFKEPGQRRGWRGYLPEEDVDNRLRYAEVPAPIFLPGRGPSATSVVQRDLGTCYLDAALMAIAHVQSSSIETMIKDHGDGTVSVRFYRGSDEHWVRINRSIVVDERGRSHYTVGEGGQLWPALVEKAYAAWRGRGWYRNIEGGSATTVFELVLGRPARTRGWDVPLPADLADGGRGRGRRGRGLDVTLGDDDRKALQAYRDSEAWKTERAALANKPAARRDLAWVDEQLAAAKKLGLTDAGEKAVHAAYAQALDGPLGSGQYGRDAKELYDLIRATTAKRLPICLSTRSWGTTPGTGISGRENTNLVPGIASDHEYMVTEAYEDENKLRWVKVVNPWQHFGRRYEKDGDKLVARAASGRRDTGKGEFAVELSDVLRYYATVQYVER